MSCDDPVGWRRRTGYDRARCTVLRQGLRAEGTGGCRQLVASEEESASAAGASTASASTGSVSAGAVSAGAVSAGWLASTTSPSAGTVVGLRCGRLDSGALGLGLGLSRRQLASVSSLGLLVRSEHHRHVATVDAREDLDLGQVLHPLGDLVEDLLAQFLVVDLPTSEHDGQLDPVALGEELLDLLGLGVEVALPDLGPVLHLLDRDVRRLLARFLGPLGGLVLVLAVVHDPTDRWIGLVGDFDEIETLFSGHGQGFRKRLDADLFAVGTHQPNFAGPDAIVDAGLAGVWRGCYCRTLLMCALGPPLWRSDTVTPEPPKTTTRAPEADARSRPRRVGVEYRPGRTEVAGWGRDPASVGCAPIGYQSIARRPQPPSSPPGHADVAAAPTPPSPPEEPRP